MEKRELSRQEQRSGSDDHPVLVSFRGSGSNWLLNMLLPGERKPWRRILRKTHDTGCKEQINWEKKRVYLYRHGKDVTLTAIKYLHWNDVQNRGYSRSFDTEYIRQKLLLKGYPIKDWIEHMDYYFGKTKELGDRIFYLRYEDVLFEPHKKMQEVVEFLELEDWTLFVDEGLSSVPHPREEPHPGVFAYHMPSLARGDGKKITPEQRVARFTRKWERSEEWTKEINEMVDDQIGEALIKYGYKL